MATANETPSAHTPGPWHVVATHLPRFLVELDDGSTIATVGASWHEGGPRETLEANARLIAAAPDLFELVLAYRQECSDQIEQHEQDLRENAAYADDAQSMFDYWTVRLRQCDTAIAKAKGSEA